MGRAWGLSPLSCFWADLTLERKQLGPTWKCYPPPQMDNWKEPCTTPSTKPVHICALLQPCMVPRLPRPHFLDAEKNPSMFQTQGWRYPKAECKEAGGTQALHPQHNTLPSGQSAQLHQDKQLDTIPPSNRLFSAINQSLAPGGRCCVWQEAVARALVSWCTLVHSLSTYVPAQAGCSECRPSWH